MRWLFTASLFCILTPVFAQVSLSYYDLPSRGHTYYQKVITSLPSRFIPETVYDSTDKEHYWDLTGVEGNLSTDTLHYYWIEGTSAKFDFPDANMVDMNPEGDNAATYFVKNETGFYFSGQDGSFGTEMGDFNIKAEFRPAVPILKVPAKLGDRVNETSRSSVDLLTLGKVNLTTNTDYEINGYGTIKIPGNEEFEVLRVKRVTETIAMVSVVVLGQEINDTTTTIETAYEFYAKGYGDAIAKVVVAFDENLGLEQYSFTYKDRRDISGTSPSHTPGSIFAVHLSQQGQLLIKAPEMASGNFKLVSMNGRVCQEWKCTGETNLISTRGLEPGIYILRAENKEGTINTRRILIN